MNNYNSYSDEIPFSQSIVEANSHQIFYKILISNSYSLGNNIDIFLNNFINKIKEKSVEKEKIV